jgi:hypothetical protein
MLHFYSGFGLAIQADRSIPGLIPGARPASIDTHIWLDDPPPALNEHDRWHPWYVSGRGEGSAPSLRAWRHDGGSYFRLLYFDGTDFVVESGGRHVWARWSASSTIEDTATYLLGPVLGLVLRLRGITCLHGSAVADRGTAIALVGPQGAGKSTTAAAFARLGYAVLADDIVPVVRQEGSWWVEPAYPQVRLWPDSVEALCGAPDALPPLTPTWDKRALDLTTTGYRFENRRLPLAAIYLLDATAGSAAPEIHATGGRAGMLSLLGNTYVSYLLENRMRAREFEDLVSVAVDVPIRRVSYSRQFAHVPGLCSAIRADCEAFGCTA